MVALSRPLTTPADEDMRWLRVEEPSAGAACRSAAVALAHRLGFPATRADQVVLAVTEAATNLHKHARDGAVLLRAGPDDTGIELVTIDSGPGVPDVGAALRDGHSTAGSLGIGLGAISRLADFCDMYSAPGYGTALVARFEKVPGPRVWPCCTGLTRPITGETECGDVYAAVQPEPVQPEPGQAGPGQAQPGQAGPVQPEPGQAEGLTGLGQAGPGLTGILCDGLGHGPLAAAAARAGVAAVLEAPDGEPAALLERAHRRMGPTRGGAVSIASVDAAHAGGPVVRFAGLGNVAGWILTAEARSGMASIPGIAGHQARKFRQFEYALPAGAAVVLHSDGLTSRWDARALPGLAGRDPLVIAAMLLAAAGRHRDDAGILVLKP